MMPWQCFPRALRELCLQQPSSSLATCAVLRVLPGAPLPTRWASRYGTIGEPLLRSVARQYRALLLNIQLVCKAPVIFLQLALFDDKHSSACLDYSSVFSGQPRFPPRFQLCSPPSVNHPACQ